MSGRVERSWDGNGPTDRLLRAALLPLSWLFRVGVAARGASYDAGILPTAKAALPVVCVGNLSVGGTGKTPTVIWLVERLLERGITPAVVARGYGSKIGGVGWIGPLGTRGQERVPGDVTAAGPGTAGWALAGDEARLVHARTGVSVATAADRAAACAAVSALSDAQLIVLDDGFQHRKLARDLDIVLVSERDRASAVLPAGPLREPLSALSRADFVVDTGRPAGAARITMERMAIGLVQAVEARAEVEPPERLAGARVAAVAGIAGPERFYDTLEALGARIEERIAFDDHHDYADADFDRMGEIAGGVDMIVTTEKDLVKWSGREIPGAQVRALRLEAAVHGGEAIVDRAAALAVGETV